MAGLVLLCWIIQLLLVALKVENVQHSRKLRHHPPPTSTSICRNMPTVARCRFMQCSSVMPHIQFTVDMTGNGFVMSAGHTDLWIRVKDVITLLISCVLPCARRCGLGRRTCGRKRRGRSWRGTRWSRVSHPLRAASSPPWPSTTWWSPTSCPLTTARPGTRLARGLWSSHWRRPVCYVIVITYGFIHLLRDLVAVLPVQLLTMRLIPNLTFFELFLSLTTYPHTSEEVPVGIIAVGTVGSTILLFIFLLVLVLIFYRQRKGSESYSLCVSLQSTFSKQFSSTPQKITPPTSCALYGYSSPLKSLLSLMEMHRATCVCPAVFNHLVFCF